MIDISAILLGLVFGLVLASAIILLLLHAAVSSPITEEETTHSFNFRNWKPVSKYESRRTFMHAAGHDPDTLEW